MKYAITIAVLVFVLVPGAFAAGVAKDPRVPALQRAVAAQNRTIGELKAADVQLAQAIALVNDKDTCTTAITWDGLVILANYVLNSNLGRLDDKGACARVGISRSPAFAFHAVSAPAQKLADLSAQLAK